MTAPCRATVTRCGCFLRTSTSRTTAARWMSSTPPILPRPPSGNCYKVPLLLSPLDIPYARRTVDVVDRSDRPAILGGLNPALRVPTLILSDGRPLAESNAILWYFGES